MENIWLHSDSSTLWLFKAKCPEDKGHISSIMPQYLNTLFTVAFTFLKGLVKQKCLVGLANYSYFREWEGGNFRGAGNSLAAVPSPRYKRRNLLQAQKKSLLLAINSFIGQNLHIFDTAHRQQLKGSHTLSQIPSWLSCRQLPLCQPAKHLFSYKAHKAEATAVKICNDGKMILNWKRSLLMRHRWKIPHWPMTLPQSDIALYSSPQKKNPMNKVSCYPLSQI